MKNALFPSCMLIVIKMPLAAVVIVIKMPLARFHVSNKKFLWPMLYFGVVIKNVLGFSCVLIVMKNIFCSSSCTSKPSTGLLWYM
jgi:hypothetical protein